MCVCVCMGVTIPFTPAQKTYGCVGERGVLLEAGRRGCGGEGTKREVTGRSVGVLCKVCGPNKGFSTPPPLVPFPLVLGQSRRSIRGRVRACTRDARGTFDWGRASCTRRVGGGECWKPSLGWLATYLRRVSCQGGCGGGRWRTLLIRIIVCPFCCSSKGVIYAPKGACRNKALGREGWWGDG